MVDGQEVVWPDKVMGTSSLVDLDIRLESARKDWPLPSESRSNVSQLCINMVPGSHCVRQPLCL